MNTNETLNPKSIFTTNSGIQILEVDETDFNWEYLVTRDYDYIKSLFPEFEHPNINGRFVIAENDKNIY